MKLKPIGKYILVKVQGSEEKTPAGIIIPVTAQEKTQEGVVMSIGEDESIKVKPGDDIIYDKYSGKEVKINGEDHLLLKADDLVAIIEER